MASDGFSELTSWDDYRGLPPLLRGEIQRHPTLTLRGVLEEYRLGFHQAGEPYREDSPLFQMGRKDADDRLAFGHSLIGIVPPEFLEPWLGLDNPNG